MARVVASHNTPLPEGSGANNNVIPAGAIGWFLLAIDEAGDSDPGFALSGAANPNLAFAADQATAATATAGADYPVTLPAIVWARLTVATAHPMLVVPEGGIVAPTVAAAGGFASDVDAAAGAATAVGAPATPPGAGSAADADSAAGSAHEAAAGAGSASDADAAAGSSAAADGAAGSAGDVDAATGAVTVVGAPVAAPAAGSASDADAAAGSSAAAGAASGSAGDVDAATGAATVVGAPVAAPAGGSVSDADAAAGAVAKSGAAAATSGDADAAAGAAATAGKATGSASDADAVTGAAHESGKASGAASDADSATGAATAVTGAVAGTGTYYFHANGILDTNAPTAYEVLTSDADDESAACELNDVHGTLVQQDVEMGDDPVTMTGRFSVATGCAELGIEVGPLNFVACSLSSGTLHPGTNNATAYIQVDPGDGWSSPILVTTSPSSPTYITVT